MCHYSCHEVLPVYKVFSWAYFPRYIHLSFQWSATEYKSVKMFSLAFSMKFLLLMLNFIQFLPNLWKKNVHHKPFTLNHTRSFVFWCHETFDKKMGKSFHENTQKVLSIVENSLTLLLERKKQICIACSSCITYIWNLLPYHQRAMSYIRNIFMATHRLDLEFW